MKRQNTIHLSEGVVRHPQVRLEAPASVRLQAGEQIAIVGANGAGKSLLVDMLTGKYPLRSGELTYDFSPSKRTAVYENIRYIAFRDTYGPTDGNYYYQQRWNTHEEVECPTVCEVLQKEMDRTHADWGGNSLVNKFKRALVDVAHEGTLMALDINGLKDKQLFLLSSGELRKVQLAKALFSTPRILILDNPFIGLDAEMRATFSRMLKGIAHRDMQLVLVLSLLDDIPEYITHVIPVCDKRVGEKMTRAAWLDRFHTADVRRQTAEEASSAALRQRILALPSGDCSFAGDEVVRLNRVSIRYGERTILRELDWTVKRGEKWALSGKNGSGKSTLLSLVCADNPQSYACDIRLFGRKRGSGESIWEIKKHIGYVSPEMHRAYLKNLPAIEIVASGLHDSIGLYKRPRPEQMDVCAWWMDVFGVAELKEQPFLQLSSGEQRLVLLARAFVKDPALLILDEPLHGLDTCNRRRVKGIIEAFCHRPDKTLIMVTHYESELPQTITHRLTL